MKTPCTLAFVLRWHMAQFISGLALLAIGVYCLTNYTPDPPDLAYETLADNLGPWPYVIAATVGTFNVLRAWSKGRKLRLG